MTSVICIGLGKRGSQWVRWAQEAEAHVVGVVDADEHTLHEQGEKLGFSAQQRFTSITAAAEQTRPTAAVICAPNHVHPIVVRECLQLGLHVLVEKPLAQSMSEAKALVALAANNNLQLTVAQQYRYSPAPKKIRQLLASGAIGHITNGLVQFYRWRPTQGMRLPILLNQAIHHFDGMRTMLGENPATCIADLWNPTWNDCDGPTVVEATFGFPNGTRIHYSGSYVARGHVTPYDALWRFEGSEGSLTFDGEQRLVIKRRTDKEEQIIQVLARTNESSVHVARDFLRAVATGTPAPTSGQDNLHTLAMIFAIEQSAQTGRKITLSEVE